MEIYAKGRIARRVAEKYWDGGSIGDEELLIGLAYWEDMANRLTTLGDVFRLASREANRISMALYDFARARGLEVVRGG